MKNFARLSPFVVSAIALVVSLVAFSGLSVSKVSAADFGPAFWLETPNADGACDFLEMPWEDEPVHYICADWISEEDPRITCCIDQNARYDGNFNDCHTVMAMPTTEDRPGL